MQPGSCRPPALQDIAGTSSLAAPSDTNPFAPDASAAYEQTGRGELQELRQELQAAQAAPGLGLRACAAAVLRKKAVLHWAANLQELVAQFGLAKLRADMQDAARIEQQAVFLAGPQRPSAVLPPPAAALPQQPLAAAAAADPALWAAVQQVAALAPDGSQRLPQLQAWPAPAPPVQPPAVPAPSGGAESQPPQQRPPQQAPMALLQPAVALAPGSSIQQQEQPTQPHMQPPPQQAQPLQQLPEQARQAQPQPPEAPAGFKLHIANLSDSLTAEGLELYFRCVWLPEERASPRLCSACSLLSSMPSTRTAACAGRATPAPSPHRSESPASARSCLAGAGLGSVQGLHCSRTDG